MRFNRIPALASIAAVLTAFSAPLLAADAKPAPLVVIVPFTQGGPTDNVARPVAEAMGHALGRPVVVKNIVGAGGTVGTLQAARAKADGNTVLLTNISQAAAPALYAKLPYDPARDFEPIGLVADVPMVLLGKNGLKAGSFEALHQYIDSHPRKLVLGHAGKGSASHLCGLLLSYSLKTGFSERAYPGTDQAVSELVTEGNVDLLCDQVSNALELVKGRSVKAFGVSTPARVDVLPDVPTFAEQGLQGVDLVVWHGLYAPKGTPQARLDALSAALRSALQDPHLKKDMAALGARLAAPDKAAARTLRLRQAADAGRWQEVVQGGRVPGR